MQVSHATGEIQPRVRTRFNYDRNAISTDTALVCKDPGKTQQQFKEECDINTIVRRFNLTGQLPENIKLPQYIDYKGIFDFQSAMQVMMEAEEQFMSVPAEIRARFNNRPQEFLEFCSNEANRPELQRLGLLKEVPPPPPPPAAPPANAGTSTST